MAQQCINAAKSMMDDASLFPLLDSNGSSLATTVLNCTNKRVYHSEAKV